MFPAVLLSLAPATWTLDLSLASIRGIYFSLLVKASRARLPDSRRFSSKTRFVNLPGMSLSQKYGGRGNHLSHLHVE